MTTTPTQETSGDSPGKTQEVVAQAQEKVQEQTDELRSRASDQLRDQVQRRSNQAGEQLDSISQALRKGAEHLQEDGNDAGAKAAHKVADQTQRLSGYLSGSNAEKLLGDAERFARRQPWLAAGIGAAVGFVAARFLKASSESRYQTSSRGPNDAIPQSSWREETWREEKGALPPAPVPTPTPGYGSP
jgi:ElaB/YqjD/DUF883 family membrane-anchored ribosome-binding protein